MLNLETRKSHYASMKSSIGVTNGIFCGHCISRAECTTETTANQLQTPAYQHPGFLSQSKKPQPEASGGGELSGWEAEIWCCNDGPSHLHLSLSSLVLPTWEQESFSWVSWRRSLSPELEDHRTAVLEELDLQ